MSVSGFSKIKMATALVAVVALSGGGASYNGALAESKPAAAAAVSTSAALAAPRAQIAKGQYKEAIAKLDLIVKNNPADAEAHLLLGQAQSKLKNFAGARDHYRQAVRHGKGSLIAQKANTALMTLPKNLTAPKTGAQTRLISSMLGLGRTRGGEAKPTVIDFYAPWCQPCKQLEGAIKRAKTAYGDKVAFMTVNVDDPSSQTIMDQYDVSPIPTMVFLSTDGEVVTYSVGNSGDASVNDGIKKILPKTN